MRMNERGLGTSLRPGQGDQTPTSETERPRLSSDKNPEQSSLKGGDGDGREAEAARCMLRYCWTLHNLSTVSCVNSDGNHHSKIEFKLQSRVKDTMYELIFHKAA